MKEAVPARAVRRDELVEVFRLAEKPASDHCIGAEGEKFGVHRVTGAPLGYGQEFGVCKVIGYLGRECGWEPVSEVPGGPVIALRRGEASVTLEPGAQLELSGEPLPDLHAVAREVDEHLAEIRPITESLGATWLFTGFHPTATLDELPWVPKARYPIMRRYLPTKGVRGLDMMQRTCTVQANFDWASEREGMQKLRLGLRIAPVLNALLANSPFFEGRVGTRLSERGDVWLHMDPKRSGLVPRVFDAREPSYEDYVEWALDAGMFLVKREGRVLENTGQTFRDFLAHGFEGEVATLDDFRLHLGTLFPEVRLKNTLEARSLDCLPPHLALAGFALMTGLFYDSVALDGAAELVEHFTSDTLHAARARLVAEGLAAPVPGYESSWALAERLVDLAQAGLDRRAKLGAPGTRTEGKTEAVFLEPLRDLLTRRSSPAADAIERYRQTGSFIRATELPRA